MQQLNDRVKSSASNLDSLFSPWHTTEICSNKIIGDQMLSTNFDSSALQL